MEDSANLDGIYQQKHGEFPGATVSLLDNFRRIYPWKLTNIPP